MNADSFLRTVAKITDDDPRFSPEAYAFVSEAVGRALRSVEAEGARRHITGAELLEAIVEQAIEAFGPMAESVLNHWGVHDTLDFGHIVFNMVDNKLLSRSENDSIDDFDQAFDLHDALTAPFEVPDADDHSPEALDL